MRALGANAAHVGTPGNRRNLTYAVDQLRSFGLDVEVVDLRSIRPLDEETILDSVEETGRIIGQEALLRWDSMTRKAGQRLIGARMAREKRPRQNTLKYE